MSAHNHRIRERRSGADRRRSHYHLLDTTDSVRIPGWQEQRLQYLTRFLFALIAVIYFSLDPQSVPYWVPLSYLVTVVGVYSLYNLFAIYTARRGHFSLTRCRVHMWVDLAMVTFCVVNDPNAIPVSLLAYAMVIMGNGMRYGMRLFREAIAGAFVACAAALALRYGSALEQIAGGTIFLCAFAGLIVIYCYVLMGRISRSQHELEKHSRYDALTGLLNRRGLHELVDLVFQLLSRGDHRATIIFADMDRFKTVNDQLGHTAGDRVLQSMGGLIRRSARSSDLMCRYGGDEFVLILPEATAAQAERVTHALQEGVKQLSEKMGVDFGCSFGVREIKVADTDFHAVLDEVDREMYRAKHGDDAAPRERGLGDANGPTLSDKLPIAERCAPEAG